jgi:hypothetical protein
VNQLAVLIAVVTFGFVGALVEAKWPNALDRIALALFPGLEGSTRYDQK